MNKYTVFSVKPCIYRILCEAIVRAYDPRIKVTKMRLVPGATLKSSFSLLKKAPPANSLKTKQGKTKSLVFGLVNEF
jgi:hypothetical protein